ncbi:MAG: LutB/LldF family L-lactate oxidation iron-sulfur protein [Pseudomonadales bacterium]|jgi:L-lactate dehydrogenase complex protein LldF|tara:strand:+ start:13837 stop:15258 length:1422 start_codon:yes stop_codon:yes gene_type:complete
MVMQYTPQTFKENSAEALADDTIRNNFRGAMDFLQAKRATVLPDKAAFDVSSKRGEAIKLRCLVKLPELLEKLEDQCKANGIHVHWAETCEQATQIIDDIITAKNGSKVVKGKSMVTEEIGLNDYLAEQNIDCIESDMGEYIVQLGGETPSHIIMPAIHKNVEQIAELFAERVPGVEYTTDVNSLIKVGREQMRQLFLDADVGISGVNFAVAETGTLCLVENEGNGRMTTTIPNTHIALTGIEKVIEHLADVPPLLELLTRSATGQLITTYVNMISGPRKVDERDGPEEVHLVLLDNGRSQAYADEELRKTLACIRCGACMNACPVYTRIGGHAYGTVYPGPIGKIISPHLIGLEDSKDLPTASSLCGACEEVCPVNIPIPSILQRLRVETNKKSSSAAKIMRGEGSGRSFIEALGWKGWAFFAVHPALYRMGTWFATRGRKLIPTFNNPWTVSRSMPKLAAKSLREQLKERG